MQLGFSTDEEAFRAEAAAWLKTQIDGQFAHLKDLRDLTRQIGDRRRWEMAMGAAGWSAIGWPREHGGRDATLSQQVIFAEEYARIGAPNRIGHIGVELIGPTILAFGTEAQKKQFLPPITAGEHIWCQGYSEPNAGSDLAAVRTRAQARNGEWVIEGQKVWTSLGHFADWIFVLARTEPGSHGRHGLSFLLVPMRQAGIDVRPIRQMTGESEFNEVFFDDAVTDSKNILGAPGDGWKIARSLLAFERGVSTLGQQMVFRNELAELIAIARANGRARDPLIRQRLAESYAGLKIMRYNALAMLADDGAAAGPEALTYKLYWSNWHRALGELAMDVLGPFGEIGAADYHFPPLTNMFMMSRAETIYAGTNEIQRNIIAERALGLPREPQT
jgi:alkylation response protein AidB-like acyl-CoA dehydrogenase